jgi:hypothetical protein
VAAAGRPPRADGGPAFVVIVAGVASAAGRAAAGDPAVTREQGQRLARAELSKAMYHPGVPIAERITNAVGRLLNAAGAAVHVGWWALVALAALLVIAIAAVLAGIGPIARSRARGRQPMLSPAQRTARDHRQEAERLAAADDYSAAVIESLRAVAVELEERGILPPRVGRTADEFAAEASQPLPGLAARLGEAARLFDEVRYGGRTGTAAGYERVRDLDGQVRAARPVPSASPSGAGQPPGPQPPGAPYPGAPYPGAPAAAGPVS